MANEAQVRSSLQIKVNNLVYQSNPTAFTATVTGTKGPTPGALTITTGGEAVDLSELVQPALCRLMNLDATNYVTVGVRDTTSGKLYKVLELLPGETYVVRLSRFMNEDYDGTGTGTGADTVQLFLQADTASVNVLVEAFEA